MVWGFVNGKLTVFNDLWQFAQHALATIKSHFSGTWRWSRIFPSRNSRAFPSMFEHTVSWFRHSSSSSHIVFGCKRSLPEEHCNKTGAFLITFENGLIWRKLPSRNNQPCVCDSTFPARSPIVSCCGNYNLFTSVYLYNWTYDDLSLSSRYWLSFLQSQDSILLSLYYKTDRNYNEFNVGLFLVSHIYSRKTHHKYYITLLFCPDGSTGYPDCGYCSAGSYSFRDSMCFKCPSGLTTKTNGSTSISDCIRCSENSIQLCQQGTCSVTPRNTMKCTCFDGYNQDNEGYCTVSSKIAITTLYSVGTIFLIVVTSISCKLYKLHQIKKRNEANLKSFENVWNIGFEEIKFDKRLDTEITGAYGEVHRSTYRQIVVAIKQLQYYQIQITKRSRAEFVREIEVMKTIRHPNVVMFFGGGTFRDGTPFLVMELMHRGSLTAILHNNAITLESETKFSFALDGARGMNYFH